MDNVGGNIFFYGGLNDGVMDYWTDELPQPDGAKLRRHLQFIKMGPDTVRQFSQGRAMAERRGRWNTILLTAGRAKGNQSKRVTIFRL